MAKTDPVCFFVCDLCGATKEATTSDVKQVGPPCCPTETCRNSEKGMPESTKREYMEARYVRFKTEDVVHDAINSTGYEAEIKDLVASLAEKMPTAALEAAAAKLEVDYNARNDPND